MISAMHPVRAVCVSLLLGTGLLWNVGCATGASQQRPARGRVAIGVTTTGELASSLTFRVTIEPAGLSASVKADAGVFTSGDVPYGDHVVRLVDVPARCRVDGGPERNISLSEKQQSTALRFSVQCS
jgi:hypothetical protein